MDGTLTPDSQISKFDPFSGPEILKVIPLTQSQIEIWLSCMLGGEEANCSYNESNSLHFTGSLDIHTFKRALENLVERHESLRSSFSGDGGNMLVYKNLPSQLSYKNLSMLSAKEKDMAMENHLLSDANHVFNLLSGPLFKATLLKLDNYKYHFTFTAHHLIIDGWSIGVIMEEMGRLYSAYLQKFTPDLPPIDSFSIFAKKQYLLLQSPKYREVEEFWLNLYKDHVPVVDLPTDHPRPIDRTYKSSRLDHKLDENLVASLKMVGVRAGFTFVNTLLTAFEVFLFHITGQDDLVIGLPASGQAYTGNHNLVGHCVNLLPIRSHPKANLTYSEYLVERRTSLYDAYEHQELTFGSLLKKLKISRDPSRIPLVPVIFNVDIGMEEDVKFQLLDFEMVSNPKKFLNFEWFLNVNGSEKTVVLEWAYNNTLFDLETMQRMMNGFTGLLHQITFQPNIRIKDILFPSNGLIEKLQEWNCTRQDFPRDVPITHFIQETAKKYSDKTAILFNNQSLTYQELDQKSNQLASWLINKGVQLEDIIGVSVNRSPEMVIVLLGILKAGGAYLPLDPDYPRERIDYMLQDSKATLLITNRSLRDVIEATYNQIFIEDLLVDINSFPTHSPKVGHNGHSLAYVLYTSGSTGHPKGVQIEHHNLVNFLFSMQIAPGIHSDDRFLAITTISFDIAGLELFLPLISGATLVLADSETAKDGRLLLKWIKEKNISLMQGTPSTWRMLLNSGWNTPLPIKILCGGEALPQDLAGKLLEKCNSVWNVYGPTETTIWSTIKNLKPKEVNITIGRPIHNTQIYILDEGRDLIAPGRIGEIYIGGEGVARGYLNRNDLNEERFLEDPFTERKEGAKMYRTGDLGKFQENGEIICLGRVDHQVKIRGHRIELGEIEHFIGKIDGVKEAVVMAREDIPGNQRLAAYLILSGKVGKESVQVPNKEQIQAWKFELQKCLPPFMIPNDWMVLDKFPLTSNNKVDRKMFPKPLTLLACEGRNEQLPSTYGQKLVANIWGKILGVNNIKLHDDFFDLGGHSLLAVDVMTQLERETRKRLPLNSLFRYPLLEEFAELFEEDKTLYNKEESWSCLVPIKPSGNKPPLYLIHGAGSYVGSFFILAKKVDAEQPIFGLQAKGLNGNDKPFTTIQEMAYHYNEVIFKHNPDGPYYIGGQSFGGYVAYEMAIQMKQINKEVKKLLLFDIDAYQSETKLSRWQKLGRKVTNELQKRNMDIMLLLNHRDTFMRQKSSSIERKKLKLTGIFKGNHTNGDVEIAHVIEKIRKINHLAMDNYLMSQYDGDIYLFKAKVPIFYIREKQYYGWRPYVNNIHLIDVDGDHNSMFDEPLVQDLGKKVQGVLDSQS